MLKLKVATVDEVLYDEQVKSITIKTTDGVITVLKDHAPLVSVIKDGYFKVLDKTTTVKDALLIINDDSTVNIIISEL
jgi:F0F1-type ATP synthase epsilon subunit